VPNVECIVRWQKLNSMEYVKSKINETYKVALKLGIKNATEIEKKVFKDMLYQITVAVSDEARNKVETVLHEQSDKYTGGV